MLKVNLTKNRILVFLEVISHSALSLNGEEFVNEFLYLGVMTNKDGSENAKVESRVMPERRITDSVTA